MPRTTEALPIRQARLTMVKLVSAIIAYLCSVVGCFVHGTASGLRRCSRQCQPPSMGHNACVRRLTRMAKYMQHTEIRTLMSR